MITDDPEKRSFSGFDLIPASSERAIAAMAWLRAPDEYKSAIEDWKAGKTE